MRYDQLKILVVDDNQHTRVMIREILTSAGVVHVLEAGDGAEALQVMRAHAVDIVLTDLAMEPVDGLDFVRMLRTAPDSPNKLVPVIMITGHSTLRRVAEARDAGVNEFLSKPLTAQGVFDRLRRVIDFPRNFIGTSDYFGPDRRRREDPEYNGPMRRRTDLKIRTPGAKS